MGVPVSLAIIAFAALIHASFQLSVSVLTLISAHAIGAKKSHARLLSLTTGFVFGAAVMTSLLLSTIALSLMNIFGNNPPQLVWAMSCGLLFGVGVSIWLFYYRRSKGTMLWIPRNFAKYLTNRTESTQLSTEAFGLGLSSVVGELLFIIAPILISSLTLIQLPAKWIPVGIAIYTIVASSSLIIVWGSIGSGHSLSLIQKWREKNKYFLQFVAGAGLIILGCFIYVNEIIATIIGKI